MKILLSALLAALLAGCATPPPPAPTRAPVAAVPVRPAIDRSLSAKGQSSRVKFVVIHYTVSDLPLSIKILTEQSVSAHYLLTDQNPPIVYGLVDETRQSNHAGVSNWKSYTQLNTSSIGIEIVNPGFTEGPAGRIWYPFPQQQIDRLIVLLKEIVARHNIPPENILGHSDIAPQRKQDPGPLFPWHQLARHGLVLWPDAARVAALRPLFEQQLPDLTWFQQKLALHGYAVPQTGELDAQTRLVIGAFQMKYRPAIHDGTPDAETAAVLDVLTAPAAAAAPATVTLPVASAPPVQPMAPLPAPLPAPIPAPVPAPIPAPIPAQAPVNQ
ncbi:MAG: N-acetylmuramoyl-L-alanine amidase [Massilia sp.]|nr:N-acetylmuramoyl-L-alanine amidase [Massilia sp.]